MRNGRFLAIAFLLILCSGGLLAAPYPAEDEDGVRIALLSPHDGTSLNAATLHVQALVAAYQDARHGTFILNGQPVAGRNAGRVREVDVALDGKIVEKLDTRCWGALLVADFGLDISQFAPGSHSVTITALQDRDDKPATAAATAGFTLDRSLTPPEVNRIEDAAMPQPFANFSIGGDEGNCGEGGEHDVDWPWRPAKEFNGRFVLGHLSDGMDFANDRIIIGWGTHVQAIEPGKFHCEQHGNRETCSFDDRSALLTQHLEFSHEHDALWSFKLESSQVQTAGNFYIRIGNDWGGIDLRSGERLVGLHATLDTGHRVQSVIGSQGGQIQTTDAAGIQIRLQVPPGALSKDTLITMTPLASSPLPDSSLVLQPGVQFDPDGLRFAQPALLTVDFSGSRQSVSPASAIFLLTSPLTTLPLYGTTSPSKKTITAMLQHFSSTSSQSVNNAFVDLVPWGDAILKKAGLATLTELQSEVELLQNQQINPDLCLSQKCLDLSTVDQAAQASLDALEAKACTQALASPSISSLTRLLALENLSEPFNVEIAGNLDCQKNVLKALIDSAGKAALSDPPNVYSNPQADQNDPTLKNLLPSGSPTNQTLADYANNLVFPDLASLCQSYFAAAIQARINRTGDLADNPISSLYMDLYIKRLEALQNIAYRTGNSPLATLALQRIDQALKNQASRDVTQAQQLGTDAAKQSAIADLNGEIATVTSNPSLAQFDPGLQPLLQQDIDKLRNVTFTVFNDAVFVGNYNNFTNPCQAGFGVPPQPLPVTISGSTCAGQRLQITVKSAGNNAVEFDAAGYAGDFSGFFDLSVTLSSASTLQVDFNPAWMTNKPARALRGLAAVNVYGSQGSPFIGQAIFDYTTGTLDNRLPVLPAGQYVFGLEVHGDVPFDSTDAFSGTGRVLTLTIK